MKVNGFETRIIILVGLPGSGKSYLSREMKNYYTKSHSSMEVQVIEYDQITKSLNRKSKNEKANIDVKNWLDDVDAWRETRSHALHLLEKHLHEMKRRAIDGNLIPQSVVIMDDNFYLRSMRREVYKICQDFVSNCPDVMGKIGFVFVHVDTNVQQCIVNNEMRKNTDEYIPQETIIKMSTSIEPPNVQKASFEHLSLSTSKFRTDSNGLLSSSIYETIDQLTNDSIMFHCIKQNTVKSEEEIEEERKITRLSVMHRTDLILRSLVSKTCKCDKSLARTANEVRKSIITNFHNSYDNDPKAEHLEEWVEAKYHGEMKTRVNGMSSNT